MVWVRVRVKVRVRVSVRVSRLPLVELLAHAVELRRGRRLLALQRLARVGEQLVRVTVFG